MLRKIKDEDAASLADRAIRQGLSWQAEFVYFELKQHHLLIQLRWGTRMRMLWRGPRSDGLEVLAYLKAASGMSNLMHYIPQAGAFAFVDEGQIWKLPAVCKPYLSEEKVFLSLPALSRDAAPACGLSSLPPAESATTVRKPKYDIDDLLDGITDENIHPEVDFGPPVGKELL